MPLTYEDAAHLFLFLTRVGLMIKPGIDCRQLLARLAHLLLVRQRNHMSLSHFGAASWIPDGLQKAGIVTCNPASRARLLAMLGTGIANIEISHRGRCA